MTWFLGMGFAATAILGAIAVSIALRWALDRWAERRARRGP